MPSASDATSRAPNSPSSSHTRSRAAVWIAGAALVGCLAGFLIQLSRVNSAQDDLTQTTRALHAARLEAALGAAVIEAQSGRYEVARQRASDFYTGLQRQLLPVIAADQQADARAMLSERDSIITSFARSDPASSGVLASVLARLRETIHDAGLDSTSVTNAPTR
ncbi:MAG TPA: hypothetical protein VE869_11975 [Gemmatimonas sp.]|nr:hypothetical protein [Gemmatimonas sp.]